MEDENNNDNKNSSRSNSSSINTSTTTHASTTSSSSSSSKSSSFSHILLPLLLVLLLSDLSQALPLKGEQRRQIRQSHFNEVNKRSLEKVASAAAAVSAVQPRDVGKQDEEEKDVIEKEMETYLDKIDRMEYDGKLRDNFILLLFSSDLHDQIRSLISQFNTYMAHTIHLLSSDRNLRHDKGATELGFYLLLLPVQEAFQVG